jgi:acyl-[acyl-carrier-protein]-phospholipid O-acyltransferase/long-chain-fatty-acid--[acyl-carrier-protein] ligase
MNRLSTSFHWLNATQFLGALNDNLFKLLLTFFLVRRLGEDQAVYIGAVGTGLFVLPFLLFATTGGYLADRFPKSRIVFWMKCLESVVMALGAAAFWSGRPLFLFATLFLMATQSALFGPSKYGIIPELAGKENLSRANSTLEAFTYLAIILGTAVAPVVAEWVADGAGLGGLCCLAVSVLGIVTSLRVGPTPAGSPAAGWTPFILRDVARTLRGVAADRDLLLALLGAAYFLMVGAFLQIQIIPYGLEVLGLSATGSGYLFLLVAAGVGWGALVAGQLSGENVEFGVVPIGAIGLTASAWGLGAVVESAWAVYGLIALMGFSAGLFLIPVQAFIQLRSPRERIGEILAAGSFLGWLGVLIAALLAYLGAGLTARQGFLFIAGLTLVLTVVSMKALPDFLIRFAGLLITRACYRTTVVGREHYPATGPALLISNHVSWVDAILIGLLRPRRLRFIMSREIYEHRGFNWLFRLMRVIPISFHDSPKKIIEAFRQARATLDAGQAVCIFAEGAITRNGLPRDFKPGFERIVRGTSFPIIPIYLGGLWGSIFSYYHGRLLSRWPVRFPYPVSIHVGRPLPAASPAGVVRQAVIELSVDYFESLKRTRRSAGEVFVQAARRNGKRRAIADTTGRDLTYRRALIGALLLAGRLERRTAGQERIGLLLPTSVGGVLANLAVTLLGKTSVNLNFTASADAFHSAIQQCGLKTIVSSRAFLEKLPALSRPEGLVFLEDLLAGVGAREKWVTALRALLVPVRWLLPRRPAADDVLTIIFSSGSTGVPKGVMLSHHNVLGNIESLRMVFRASAGDSVAGILPLFHSFGYTGCLWFPLLNGAAAAYHPNPLDAAGVGRVVEQYRSTILFATPTFLVTYVRRIKPESFRSLRVVVAGAEKLKPRVADAFRQQFGIQPLEGYGATELSPAVSFNIPDVELDGVTQVGTKPGTVGHPVPGVAARVVHPETGETLPPGSEGLLLIRGPNVMKGYLDRPDLTAEVIRDGWYQTGDVARLDDDGFITITDRLARFSKIGGEMVPHLRIEEEYHRRLNVTEQVVAITAVPDEKKGERLVVLHLETAGTVDTLHRAISESELPNLWKPARDSYVKVDAFPVLGSGKLDLSSLRKLAEQKLGLEE